MNKFLIILTVVVLGITCLSCESTTYRGKDIITNVVVPISFNNDNSIYRAGDTIIIDTYYSNRVTYLTHLSKATDRYRVVVVETN